MEKLVSKLRKTDAAYTDGYVEPGAMPPPYDYFLGYRSPGTEVRRHFACYVQPCSFHSLFVSLRSAIAVCDIA